MDSNQEAANLAQIENTRLSRKLVTIGIATLIVCAIATVFAALPVLWPPDPSRTPDPNVGGGIMVRGWLPVIVLVSCSLILAISLLVVAFKQFKNKRLRTGLSRVTGESKANRNEADELGRTVTDLKAQNLGIDNALKLAELKLGQWERLTNSAAEQETTIDDHVRLDEVTLGQMNLTGSDPTVRFGIHVTNKSFLDISLDYDLDDPVKGKIEFSGFKTIDLRGTKTVVNTVKDLPPGGSGCLTIEQRLIDNEPTVIREAEGLTFPLFHFPGLIINIVGGKQSPDVGRMPLVMGNATVSAFPMNLQERGQRIRALSEIRGSAAQLCQVSPLSHEVLERWEQSSLITLGKVYSPEAASKLWGQITRSQSIPIPTFPQRGWLESCIVELGGILGDETGEYINRKTVNA